MTPEPMPEVPQRVRRSRRLRVFVALGALVAVVAAVVVVVRVVDGDGSAGDKPPADYSENGMTVPGTIGADRLLKPWVGEAGQGKFAFAWTPGTDSISVSAHCSGVSGATRLRVKIGDWPVAEGACAGGWEVNRVRQGADSPIWLDQPVGKEAQVSGELIDAQSRPVVVPGARIAMGIYSSSAPETDSELGVPSRVVPADDGAYVKDGVTYRAKVGGATLLGAAVGSTEVRVRFTSPGTGVVLRLFCTANRGAVDGGYRLSVKTDDTTSAFDERCDASSTDAATGTMIGVGPPASAGVQAEVVVRIVPDKPGTAVPANTRLGLGVYAEGAQRKAGDASLDEKIEVLGYDYRLADVKTAAPETGTVSIATPADQRFVLVYGSTPLLDVEEEVDATLSVRKTEREVSGSTGPGGALGLRTWPYPAGPGDRATLTLTKGKPLTGSVDDDVLVLAVYVPA
ncbi:hypothetical protein [Kribbella sp. NPDC055071]